MVATHNAEPLVAGLFYFIQSLLFHTVQTGDCEQKPFSSSAPLLHLQT